MTQPSPNKKSETICRICGKKLAAGANAPFCSDRCRMNDLSKWFGESYRIASSREQDAEEASGNAAPQGEDHEPPGS